MKAKQLAEEIYQRSPVKNPIKPKVASKVLTEFFRTVKEAIADGEQVSIREFGTFYPQKRKARKGRNIHTNKMFVVPPCQVPSLRFSPSVKGKSL